MPAIPDGRFAAAFAGTSPDAFRDASVHPAGPSEALHPISSTGRMARQRLETKQNSFFLIDIFLLDNNIDAELKIYI